MMPWTMPDGAPIDPASIHFSCDSGGRKQLGIAVFSSNPVALDAIKIFCMQTLDRNTCWFLQSDTDTYLFFEFWIDNQDLVLSEASRVAEHFGLDLDLDPITSTTVQALQAYGKVPTLDADTFLSLLRVARRYTDACLTATQIRELRSLGSDIALGWNGGMALQSASQIDGFPAELHPFWQVLVALEEHALGKHVRKDWTLDVSDDIVGPIAPIRPWMFRSIADAIVHQAYERQDIEAVRLMHLVSAFSSQQGECL